MLVDCDVDGISADFLVSHRLSFYGDGNILDDIAVIVNVAFCFISWGDDLLLILFFIHAEWLWWWSQHCTRRWLGATGSAV